MSERHRAMLPIHRCQQLLWVKCDEDEEIWFAMFAGEGRLRGASRAGAGVGAATASAAGLSRMEPGWISACTRH